MAALFWRKSSEIWFGLLSIQMRISTSNPAPDAWISYDVILPFYKYSATMATIRSYDNLVCCPAPLFIGQSEHAWHLCAGVVHGSDGPAVRVGSGRVTISPDFGGSGRVGSGQHLLIY